MMQESDGRIASAVKRVALVGLLLLLAQVAVVFTVSEDSDFWPPLSGSTVFLIVGSFMPTDRLALAWFAGGFLFASFLALTPVLVRPHLAQRATLFVLTVCIGLSAATWLDSWPDYRWGFGRNLAIAVATLNLAFATACLLQLRSLRCAPEGSGFLRLPLLMQFWFQTVWIPYPPMLG